MNKENESATCWMCGGLRRVMVPLTVCQMPERCPLCNGTGRDPVSGRLPDAARYPALREDIKRRLAEVRRDKETEGDDASKYGKGYYDGEIGALVNLLWRDDVRNEAPHNATSAATVSEATKTHQTHE